MRRPLFFPLALVSLVGACAALPAARSESGATDLLKAANEHLETCERHYQGGFGVGAALTFRIDCPAAERAAARRPATEDQERNGTAGPA